MSHSHSHPPASSSSASPGDPVEFTQEFWDDRYGSAGRLWSGQPNVQLVAQVADLVPGEALDAGCGEGADAIWLARHGWTVTAVDVSAVALDRAAAAAASGADVTSGASGAGVTSGAGVAGGDVARRITWRREDLRSWIPEPDGFDLVSAQFMHFPRPDLEVIHRRLAAAVRPGGTLLLVAHHPDDLHAARRGRPDMFWYAEDIAASLDPERWEVRVAETAGRPAIDTDGQPVMIRDTVLRATRRPGSRS